MTNALAYYVTKIITAVNGSIVQPLWQQKLANTFPNYTDIMFGLDQGMFYCFTAGKHHAEVPEQPPLEADRLRPQPEDQAR